MHFISPFTFKTSHNIAKWMSANREKRKKIIVLP